LPERTGGVLTGGQEQQGMDIMTAHSRRLIVALAGIAALTISSATQAQNYPTRPITIVVTAAAGGPGDTSARLIVDRLSALLGQQVIVENVPGAGGITGTARVARAVPDGHTLMVQQTGLTIAPSLYNNLTFDVEKDFAPIALINAANSFFVGRKDLPPNDVKELVAWVKASGKPAKFAHPGVGTLGHLHTVLVTQAFGIEADLIPYRGGAPAMNDIVGGHVDLNIASSSTSAPLVKAGNVKPYLFLAPKRYPTIDNVPSAVDVGKPDLAIRFWHALYAPAGTPAPVIATLNAALRQTLTDPEVMKGYEARGLTAFPADQLSPEAAKSFIHGEIQRWGKVVRDNKITIKQ
jgi:tripartite-type tricarboxylate transporter receptor subunit TctC